MARVPGLPTDEVVIVVGSRAPTVGPFLHLMPVSQVGNPAQDAVGCWSSEELESMGVGGGVEGARTTNPGEEVTPSSFAAPSLCPKAPKALGPEEKWGSYKGQTTPHPPHTNMRMHTRMHTLSTLSWARKTIDRCDLQGEFETEI